VLSGVHFGQAGSILASSAIAASTAAAAFAASGEMCCKSALPQDADDPISR
jgi:hypothetical protein